MGVYEDVKATANAAVNLIKGAALIGLVALTFHYEGQNSLYAGEKNLEQDGLQTMASQLTNAVKPAKAQAATVPQVTVVDARNQTADQVIAQLRAEDKAAGLIEKPIIRTQFRKDEYVLRDSH